MKKLFINSAKLLLAFTIITNINVTNIFAQEVTPAPETKIEVKIETPAEPKAEVQPEQKVEEPKKYVANDVVNVRVSNNTESEVVKVLEAGAPLNVITYDKDNWSTILIDDKECFVKSEFIILAENYVEKKAPVVELINWKEAKEMIKLGADIKVVDVKSGITYNIRSFSNGNHADVETITKDDTALMKKSYGGSWSWDTRAVHVTINGRVFAASISGMPHGGGINSSNGMDGQVCLHFLESTTHNGNKSHEKDHQASVAYAAKH